MDVFLTEYQAEMEHWVSTGDLKPGAFKALNGTLVKLRARFRATLLCDITNNELFQWLSHLPLHSITKEGHRAYCVQVFNANHQNIVEPLLLSKPGPGFLLTLSIQCLKISCRNLESAPERDFDAIFENGYSKKINSAAFAE